MFCFTRHTAGEIFMENKNTLEDKDYCVPYKYSYTELWAAKIRA
jgi:hypothetical protein